MIGWQQQSSFTETQATCFLVDYGLSIRPVLINKISGSEQRLNISLKYKCEFVPVVSVQIKHIINHNLTAERTRDPG